MFFAMSHIKYLGIFFCFIAFLYPNHSYGFEPFHLNSGQLDTGYINLGSNKLYNTYLFNMSGEYTGTSNFGYFGFVQDYSGSAVTLGDKSIRDDEKLKLFYNLPLFENVLLVAGTNWTYTADSKSVGINKLERINLPIGITHILIPGIYYNISFAPEQYTQIDNTSQGNTIFLKAKIDELELDGYNLNLDLNAERVNLSKFKKTEDWLIDAKMFKSYSAIDNIDLALRYKQIERNYIYSSQSAITIDNIYENRSESRFGGDFNTGFVVIDKLNALINLQFDNVNVYRSFNKNIIGNNSSYIERGRNEQKLGLNSELNYLSSSLKQKIGIALSYFGEKNTAKSIFNLNDDEFRSLRKAETDRDIITTGTRLFSKSQWNISQRDTLGIDYSVSLFQTDTPSDENKDDRDEFWTLFALSFSHRFSPYLSGSIKVEGQLSHLVFLRKERSANNNKNRIIRLNPGIVFDNGRFSFQSNFEVLANYTVYDFEKLIPGLNGYSFRQISWKDSVCYKFNEQYQVESRVSIRYFYDRSSFNWTDFSESPQSGNLEEFIKILLFYNLSNSWKIGLGARYYSYVQEKFNQGGAVSSITQDHSNWGPELVLASLPTKGIFVNLNARYEFSNINKIQQKPNAFVYLQTFFAF